ncbi:hypothetical protein ACLOJK_034766, partial [Asimina triloba]
MSTMLAFRFVTGGGFALRDHRSFDPAILHHFIYFPTLMARQTYHHIDFSPIAIRLATGENWPTPSTTVMAPRPSRRALLDVSAKPPLLLLLPPQHLDLL